MLCGFFESEPATLQRRERAQPHVPGAVSAHGPRPRASVRAFERNGHGIGRGHVRERFGRSPAKGSPAKRPTPAAQGATPGVCGQQCLLAVVRPRRGCRSGLATCTIPRSVRSLCTGHRAPFLSALPRAYHFATLDERCVRPQQVDPGPLRSAVCVKYIIYLCITVTIGNNPDATPSAPGRRAGACKHDR